MISGSRELWRVSSHPFALTRPSAGRPGALSWSVPPARARRRWRNLARRLELPHIELDALHWEPNWTEASTEVFRRRTEEALQADGWVADGNYSKVRDLVWGSADLLVWLDYALPVIMGRLVSRTLRRVITREVLWNGNQEEWRVAFFSRDSLWLWVLQSYRRRRKQYPVQFARAEYCHLEVLRLRSPRATRQWLSGMGRTE